MYWLAVKLNVEGKPIDNIINVDTIVRFGPDGKDRSYMHFVDGSSVNILDSYSQLVSELTKMKET